MMIGYVRVSTLGQARNGNSMQEQKESIHERYPDAEIRIEAKSGARERPVFIRLLEELGKGDTLVVTKLDRFCRTTKEGLKYIDRLMEKGVRIHILNMGLVEDTPMGRLIVTNLLAFAEFERAMIVERTQAGKEIAKQRPGWKEGRPRVAVDIAAFKRLAKEVERGQITITEASQELGINRSKWYRLAQEYSIGFRSVL